MAGKPCVSGNDVSLESMKKINIICFGGEDWWYKNHGHIDMQLMRFFARLGTVLYVNSIVMQKPSLRKNIGGGKSFTHKLIRKAKSILRGLRESGVGFWVYSPSTLPVHHLPWARPINEMILRCQIHYVARKLVLGNPIIWIACPAACDTAIKIKKSLLVYQRTDRYEEYPNVDYDIIRKYDLKLKTSSDLTVFVNRTLFDEEAGQCKKAIYLDHGVDYEMFSMAEQDQHKPEDIGGIPKPIIGFFGAIDEHTSDIAFVEKTVDLLPQMSFVFIGSISADITGLQKRKNVWLLGQKPYEQIPHYGKCFDVAIMPWRQNRWIEVCNPIKFKEYLALGKPIVSTPFPELQKYRNVVYQAKTPEEFAKYIKKAMAEDGPDYVAARRKKVEASTWNSKGQLILEELFGKDGDLQESA